MKLMLFLGGLAVLALGCASDAKPGVQSQQAAYRPVIIDRPPSDNRYDQPGALPANSGGTDAGRIGTDERYQPVR